MRVKPEQIREWCQEVKIEPHPDPDLMVAIAKAESSLRPNVVNKKSNAKGLFQLTPICLKEIRIRWKKAIDPFDPQQATEGATLYISWLLEKFPNDLTLVLASWNWGIGNVRKWQKGLKSLPRETRRFTDKVLREWERLKKAKKCDPIK